MVDTFKQIEKQTRPVFTNFNFGKPKKKERKKKKKEFLSSFYLQLSLWEKESYSNLIVTDNEVSKLHAESDLIAG